MKCYVHPEADAIGTCVGCGKFICESCQVEVSNKNYCSKCVNELLEEKNKKIEKLNENNQPMVFMNAGGSSSSSSSSANQTTGGHPHNVVPLKNKVLAGLLAIFLGGIGVHKFYLGKPIQGIIYLLFCWTTIPGFIGLIEGIVYFCTSDRDFAQKYGAKYY